MVGWLRSLGRLRACWRQARVREAAAKLEAMRDEWLDVKGKASSDQDMMESLQNKTKAIKEQAEQVGGRPARPVLSLFFNISHSSDIFRLVSA